MVKENTVLEWRHEFAVAALDEHISGGDLFDYCEFNIFLASKTKDLRQVEFGLLGLKVKRRLLRCDTGCAVRYLEMLEDCFEFPAVRSN